MKKMVIVFAILSLLASNALAQTRHVSTLFQSGKIIESFWLNADKQLIGVLNVGSSTVIDLQGKIQWQTPLRFNKNLLAIEKGEVTALSSDDGKYLWQKKLIEGSAKLIFDSNNGYSILSSVEDKEERVLVISDDGEVKADYLARHFEPLAILPSGTGVLGILIDRSIQLKYLNILTGHDTYMELASSDSALLYSGEDEPSIVMNPFNNTMAILCNSAHWLIIIDEHGNLLYKTESISGYANIITFCADGFILAKTYDRSLSFIDTQGNTRWTKAASNTIQAISGNNSQFAVSIGNMGYPGEIVWYDKDGRILDRFKVDLALDSLKMNADGNLIGVRRYSEIMLF